tara:strand:- start:16941 stop:17708 length:768 start_codon:yes stop_codon:yes gene_type:complete
VAQKALNILIMEDSLTQAKFIRQMFEHEGAKVEVITTAKDLSYSPHLFDLDVDGALIDVHLGDVNGLQLIDALKRRWPSLCLVMMTANDTNDFSVLAEAREQGAHLVLKKPFGRSDVASVLADVQAIKKTGEPRKHVVVIDDSKVTCKIASQVLSAYGYRVSSFQTGEEAIKRLSYDQVDVVLTDINMPGMSGPELICLIRDVWRNVGIVGMSADEKAISKCGDTDAFVPKPFSPEELIAAIRKAAAIEHHELEC